METMNDFELNNMRQQMETLKKKLSAQEIVNDRLIRRSMRDTAGSISRRYWILIAVAVLMVPYGYWALVMLSGFSVAFWIATSVFMLVCAGATFYNSSAVRNSNIMSNDLLDVRRRMARAKKFENQWLLFSIPLLLVWLGWFFYEAYQQDGYEGQGLIYAGIVGGIIGGIIGFRLHFKTQRQYQEILDQIEDLEDAR